MINEYSIWLLPEAAQQRRLLAVVNDLAGRFGTERFIPHVTIQGDLTMSFDALSVAVMDIARDYAVQRWPVAGVEGSEHFFRSLYLRFQETPAYVAMKQKMQKISGTEVGLSLFPHLSLAYGLTAGQKSRALYEELQTLAAEPLVLDRIVIARSSKNVPIADWACLAEFPFA